jgi:hypothetical protein
LSQHINENMKTMKTKNAYCCSLKTAAVLLVIGLLGCFSQPAFAHGTAAAFSGRATVVSANVLGLPVVVCDTGPLPSSGGKLETSLLSASVPNLASAEVCHAVTYGQGDTSYSESSAANVALTVGGNRISAGFIRSWAMAVCCDMPTPVSISGRSDLLDLMINGQRILVTGQPNQTIPLLNGKVVINEQITFLGADSGEITVNALHVIVNGVAEVIVSSAHADVLCSSVLPPPPPPAPGECDFITGGGWITGTPSGAKGNFGVAGGFKNGAFWGHLNYIDHGNGMHVKHTAVTGYAVDPGDPDCRLIDYNVTIDGQLGTARVRVCDKGEPGRDDVFEIALSNGYRAGGDLGGSRPGGGNIQLHKCD